MTTLRGHILGRLAGRRNLWPASGHTFWAAWPAKSWSEEDTFRGLAGATYGQFRVTCWADRGCAEKIQCAPPLCSPRREADPLAKVAWRECHPHMTEVQEKDLDALLKQQRLMFLIIARTSAEFPGDAPERQSSQSMREQPACIDSCIKRSFVLHELQCRCSMHGGGMRGCSSGNAAGALCLQRTTVA